MAGGKGGAVASSISVLKAFHTLGGGTQPLHEIARATERIPSTVLKILCRLEEQTGLVERVGPTGWRLGSGMLELGQAAATTSSLRETAPLMLAHLRQLTNAVAVAHTVCHLRMRSVLAYDAGERKAEWLDALPAEALLAELRDLRVGAAGRAILAHLDDETVKATLSRPWGEDVRIQHSAAILREDLDEIRTSGYAISYGESPPDWASVAAPIFWDAEALGAVSLMAPISEMSDAESQFVPLVIDAAQRLSESHQADGQTASLRLQREQLP